MTTTTTVNKRRRLTMHLAGKISDNHHHGNTELFLKHYLIMTTCKMHDYYYCTFDLNLQPPNLRQIHRDFWWPNQPILWLC